MVGVQSGRFECVPAIWTCNPVGLCVLLGGVGGLHNIFALEAANEGKDSRLKDVAVHASAGYGYLR
jgi:hypothetical protein